MGLFDFMKQKGRRAAEPVSYVPECLELPKSNYDELFDEFQPEWADQFPDFPYEFQGRPAIRTTLTERMRDMFSIAPQAFRELRLLFGRPTVCLLMLIPLLLFPSFPSLCLIYRIPINACCVFRFALFGASRLRKKPVGCRSFRSGLNTIPG